MNRHSAFFIFLGIIMFIVYPCYVLLVPSPASGWDILVPCLTWIVPLYLGFANLGWHGKAVRGTEVIARGQKNIALIALMKSIEGELEHGEKLNANLPAPQRCITTSVATINLLQSMSAAMEYHVKGSAKPTKSDDSYDEPMACYPAEMRET